MKWRFIFVCVAGALMTACSSGGGGADSFKATAQAAGVEVPAEVAPTESPVALASPTPFPVEPAQQIEVTRIVTQPAQIIERTVEVIITATPDIAGFDDVAGVDESIQPCPVKYWRNGRCVATDAQIEQYANEVQP